MIHWHPIEFYRPEDHEKMSSASTFEELHRIAYGVLLRIEPSASMVCGPITSGGLGSVEKNLTRFECGIALLAKYERNIFTQLPFEGAMARVRNRCLHNKVDLHLLETFYYPLFASGRVEELCFLPHWESSYGTRWEHEQAEHLGLRRKYFRPDFELLVEGESLFIPDEQVAVERFLIGETEKG